jgi:hypothetical protein
MGFRYLYSANDMADAVRTINAIKYDACDMKNDSYVQWGAKQDLYRLKWILDQALRDCPTFSPEEEWLKEQEQKKIIKYLKDEM